MRAVYAVLVAISAASNAIADTRWQLMTDWTADMPGYQSVGYSTSTRGRLPAAMQTACVSSTDVTFRLPGAFIGISKVTATFAIDGEKVGSLKLDVDKEGSDAYLWNGRGIPLLLKLIGKETLSVTFDVGGPPIEARFEVSTIETAVEAISKACGWKFI